MRIDRYFSSIGVRLAAVQAGVLIGAFLIAGALVLIATSTMLRGESLEQARSEALSLQRGFVEDGRRDVVEAIARRTGKGSGLHYRLVDAAGRQVIGDLPPARYRPGVQAVSYEPKRDDADDAIQVFTVALSDGALLSVGHETEFTDRLIGTLLPILLLCGIAGAVAGLALSIYFSRRLTRRIDALAETARSVAGGNLDVRVPLRATSTGRRDDLDTLGGAANEMLEEIARLVANLRQISVDVAHDLRTPLTRVRQRVELLRLRSDDPELLATVEPIEADLEALLRLFAAMLRLAELEAGANLIERQSVDLKELAERIAYVYRPDIEQAGRQLELDTRPGHVEGDAALIGQAMANLIENAIRHTPVGTTIRLSTWDDDGRGAFFVADNGPGIPSADRGRIFERFVRLETSRSTSGAGLGLSLVAAVARRHGATLELDDIEPGTRVALRFPKREQTGGG